MPESGCKPKVFFAGHPLGTVVLQRVQPDLDSFADVQVRTSRSQVAFRR